MENWGWKVNYVYFWDSESNTQKKKWNGEYWAHRKAIEKDRNKKKKKIEDGVNFVYWRDSESNTRNSKKNNGEYWEFRKTIEKDRNEKVRKES